MKRIRLIAPKLCAHCNNQFLQRRKSQIYCSKKCGKDVLIARYYHRQPRAINIPSGTTGAMHELKVAVDLMNNGYNVFRALSPACPCDLAVLIDGRLVLVEVTTGFKLVSGRITHGHLGKNDSGKYDILAIVFYDNSIIYRPTIEEFIELTSVAKSVAAQFERMGIEAESKVKKWIRERSDTPPYPTNQI